jgi:hypothetical protein
MIYENERNNPILMFLITVLIFTSFKDLNKNAFLRYCPVSKSVADTLPCFLVISDVHLHAG